MPICVIFFAQTLFNRCKWYQKWIFFLVTALHVFVVWTETREGAKEKQDLLKECQTWNFVDEKGGDGDVWSIGNTKQRIEKAFILS